MTFLKREAKGLGTITTRVAGSQQIPRQSADGWPCAVNGALLRRHGQSPPIENLCPHTRHRARGDVPGTADAGATGASPPGTAAMAPAWHPHGTRPPLPAYPAQQASPGLHLPGLPCLTASPRIHSLPSVGCNPWHPAPPKGAATTGLRDDDDSDRKEADNQLRQAAQ